MAGSIEYTLEGAIELLNLLSDENKGTRFKDLNARKLENSGVHEPLFHLCFIYYANDSSFTPEDHEGAQYPQDYSRKEAS